MTKIAVLFPGQGSQYIKMGKYFVENFAVAQEVFEEANDALGFDLKKMIFEGDMAELTHSANAQPAVITASYALFRVYLQEFGKDPCFTAGHSLGEISALIAAEGMSFKDGLKFARKRGTLMHQAFDERKGRVAIVMRLSEEEIESKIITINNTVGYVAITAYNSPEQILVAGEERALSELGNALKNLGGEFIPFSMLPMKVDAPYHSVFMSFLVDRIGRELDKIDFSNLRWNVVSNITALPYISRDDIKVNLSQQLIKAVKWRQSISYLEEQGVTIAIDIGPQYTIKTLVSECSRKITSYAFDIKNDFLKLYKDLNK